MFSKVINKVLEDQDRYVMKSKIRHSYKKDFNKDDYLISQIQNAIDFQTKINNGEIKQELVTVRMSELLVGQHIFLTLISRKPTLAVIEDVLQKLANYEMLNFNDDYTEVTYSLKEFPVKKQLISAFRCYFGKVACDIINVKTPLNTSAVQKFSSLLTDYLEDQGIVADTEESNRRGLKIEDLGIKIQENVHEVDKRKYQITIDFATAKTDDGKPKKIRDALVVFGEKFTFIEDIENSGDRKLTSSEIKECNTIFKGYPVHAASRMEKGKDII